MFSSYIRLLIADFDGTFWYLPKYRSFTGFVTDCLSVFLLFNICLIFLYLVCFNKAAAGGAGQGGIREPLLTCS